MPKYEFSPGGPKEPHLEVEPNYKFNLETHRPEVIRALIAMEGEKWFEDQKSWGEFSIDGAYAKARENFLGMAFIPGYAGGHSYIVTRNGDVYYSENSGRKEIPQAVALGFKLWA